jgi:hypothetical chaperone protein
VRICTLASIAAGFKDVSFVEPEAAAPKRQRLENAGEIGLIVDIGGGTSDFFRVSIRRNLKSKSSIMGCVGGTEILTRHHISSRMPLAWQRRRAAQGHGAGHNASATRDFLTISRLKKDPTPLYRANLSID